LRINDPLGIDGDDSVDDDQFPEPTEGNEPGIRPMEPLQPSSRRKKGSNYSKRAENAKLSAAVGATATRHPRAGEDLSAKLADLERQMKEAAARLDFEEAARLRDIIRGMQ
jgi:excinuclease ABC subunit B